MFILAVCKIAFVIAVISSVFMFFCDYCDI